VQKFLQLHRARYFVLRLSSRQSEVVISVAIVDLPILRNDWPQNERWKRILGFRFVICGMKSEWRDPFLSYCLHPSPGYDMWVWVRCALHGFYHLPNFFFNVKSVFLVSNNNGFFLIVCPIFINFVSTNNFYEVCSNEFLRKPYPFSRQVHRVPLVPDWSVCDDDCTVAYFTRRKHIKGRYLVAMT